MKNASLLSYFTVYSDNDGNVELLPADNHAAAYPLVFNSRQNSVTRGEINFFNKPLITNYYKRCPIEMSRVEWKLKSIQQSKCLVINLLDNCYGHSLLKMFNLQPLFSEYSGEFDLMVIVHKSIAAFLPSEKMHLCIVSVPFYDLENCYELDVILDEVRKNYSDYDVAFLNTYFNYPERNILIEFFNLTSNQAGKPPSRSIIFYYRKDPKRSWGLSKQRKRIIKFFKLLRSYFDESIPLIVIGEKDDKLFPPFILDQRCEKFDDPMEFKYNDLLTECLFVTGVHGSHLIMPSLLARQVFHLVPVHKWRNVSEDAVNFSDGIVSSYLRNIHLSGSFSLLFYSAKKAAEKCTGLYLASLEKEFKLKSEEYCKHGMGQTEYLTKNNPFFNVKKAIKLKNKKEKQALRLLKVIRRLV